MNVNPDPSDDRIEALERAAWFARLACGDLGDGVAPEPPPAPRAEVDTVGMH